MSHKAVVPNSISSLRRWDWERRALFHWHRKPQSSQMRLRPDGFDVIAQATTRGKSEQASKIQTWAKKWSLGCENCLPGLALPGSCLSKQVHFLAHLCTLTKAKMMEFTSGKLYCDLEACLITKVTTQKLRTNERERQLQTSNKQCESEFRIEGKFWILESTEGEILQEPWALGCVIIKPFFLLAASSCNLAPILSRIIRQRAGYKSGECYRVHSCFCPWAKQQDTHRVIGPSDSGLSSLPAPSSPLYVYRLENWPQKTAATLPGRAKRTQSSLWISKIPIQRLSEREILKL